MIITGIDCGKEGIVAFQKDRTICKPLPYNGKELNARALYAIMDYPDEQKICMIEKQQVMAKTGSVASFSIGKNYGIILAVLTMLNYEIHEVTPAVWKKKMGITSDKDSSVLLCQKLYPDIELVYGKRKKADDNMAEALLLIEYYKRYVR